MLNFEDIYEEITDTVSLAVHKFKNRLKADKEDLEQELLISIFNNLDKVEKVKQDNNKWQGYVYVMCLNYLKNLEVKEHKQGLWLNNSYDGMCCLDNEYIDDRFIYQNLSNVEIDIKDPFLEWYYEKSRQYSKKWRENNKEYCKKWREEHKEYRKQYYQENKEKIKEYRKQYYQENKKKINDKHNEYMKEYRKKNKEKMNAYMREWKRKKKEQQLEDATV